MKIAISILLLVSFAFAQDANLSSVQLTAEQNKQLEAKTDTSKDESTLSKLTNKFSTTYKDVFGEKQQKIVQQTNAKVALQNIDFSKFEIQKGIKKLNSLSFSTQNLSVANGQFTCPDVNTINDPLIASYKEEGTLNQNIDVSILDANFNTGHYVCKYTFLAKNNYYELKLVNERIKNEREGIFLLETFPSDIAFKKNYGILKIEDTLNVSKDTAELFEKLKTAGLELQKELKNYKPLDLRKMIDSSKEFDSSVASKLTGLLTVDDQFLAVGGQNVNADGSLRFLDEDAKKITTLDETNEIDVDKMIGTMAGLDAKFWGFYNYLIHNINSAWTSIVTMLFGLGGIFFIGSTMARQAIDENNKIQINWKKKLLSMAFAMTFFTAPIVPTASNLNPDFMFNEKSGASEFTSISHTALRYFFQTGTFFANQIADTALFSYLKYVGNEYGNYDANAMLLNYKKDVKSFLANTKTLENKINFFESTCAVNYSHRLLKDGDLVSYASVTEDPNIETKSYDNLSHNLVNYELCSKVLKDIKKDSSSLLLTYKNSLKNYKKMADKLLYLKQSDLDEYNRWATYVTNINNTYGWISVAMVPAMTTVLEYKQIFKFTESIEELQEDVNGRIGETKPIKSNLKRDQKESNFNDAEDASWWVSISKFFGNVKDYFVDPVQNFLQENIGGPAAGTIMGYSFFFLMPGFDSLFNFVQQSGIVDLIMTVSSAIINVAKGALAVATGGVSVAVFGAIELASNLISSGAGEDKGIIYFLIAFIFAIGVYFVVMSTLAIILTSLFVVLKIILYHIDLIATFFISVALMFWTLSTGDKEGEMYKKFFGKVVVLSLTPLSIVMSVYVYIFAAGILRYLWDLSFELIFSVSMETMNQVDGSSLMSQYQYIQIYALNTFAGIIFQIVSIFLSYIILFKFHERIMNYFGMEDGGVAAMAGRLFDNMSHKLSKV